MRVRALVAVLPILAAVLVGCGSDDKGAEPQNTELTSPEARYGLGPVRDPATTYQPDVVLIENGPKAIRSAGGDGLTWTMDAKAGGVGDLQPGKIMFATNQAVGRIHELRRSGDDVIVTLVPAGLTEVIKDGNFSVDRPIDLDAMLVQDLPGLIEGFAALDEEHRNQPAEPDPIEPTAPTEPAPPTEPEEPTTETPTETPTETTAETTAKEEPPAEEEPAGMRGDTLRLPALKLAPSDVLPAPKFGEKMKMTVGAWKAEVFRKSGEIGLSIQRKGKSGLKVGIMAKISASNPRITSTVPISNGTVGNASFSVSGFNAVSIDISAGAENGVSDNTKGKVELPMELLDKPSLLFGVPVVHKVKFKFLATSGFTQKQTTLTAHGTVPLSGSLGIGTDVSTGAIKVLKKLLGEKVKIEHEAQLLAKDFYTHTDTDPEDDPLCKTMSA